MSLVHEALRKAEREKQRKLGVAPSASAPQPIQAPVVHAPVVVTTAPVVRGVATPQSVSMAEPAPATNHYLLPALIGCVAIVAIIAIVFLVSNASFAFRQSKEAPAVATAAPALASAAETKSTEAVPSPAPVQPVANAITPATISPSPVPTADNAKYKISGIMKDPDGKPVAVLNGRVAYEGYFIDGATVKKIETDRVVLDVNGHDVAVRLF